MATIAQPARSPFAPLITPFRVTRNMLRPILRTTRGKIGFFSTLFFMLVAIFGPVVLPNPRTDVDARSLAPSLEHPFGTDFQGKDILTLTIRGGRDVVLIALITGGLTTLIAIVLGSLAAYLGGVVDQVITGTANFILTIPYLILVSVLAAFIKFDNAYVLAPILAALFWPSLMRTIRAQVYSLRERDYIEAAVALDLGIGHIIVREILPNMASYIIVNLIFAITSAVYSQIALIFLGLVPLSGMNWGVMMSTANKQGAINSASTVWWLLLPVNVIALLQWSLITLAGSIEDAFNPRLRS